MIDIQELRESCDHYYGFDPREIAPGGARTYVNIDNNDEIFSVNSTTKLALDFYNRKNQKDFNLVKVYKLNALGVYYYITFSAQDGVSDERRLFRCVVNLLKEKVLLCEIKYDGEISNLVDRVDDYVQKLGESDENQPPDICKNALGDGSAPGFDGVILVSPTMFHIMGKISVSDLPKLCDDYIDPCLYEKCGGQTFVDVDCFDWVTEYAKLAINSYNKKEQKNFILVKVEKLYLISVAHHYCMTFWARNSRSDECRLFRAIFFFKGDDEDDSKHTIPAEQDDVCVQSDGDRVWNIHKDGTLDYWGVDAATNSTLVIPCSDNTSDGKNNLGVGSAGVSVDIKPVSLNKKRKGGKIEEEED